MTSESEMMRPPAQYVFEYVTKMIAQLEVTRPIALEGKSDIELSKSPFNA